MGNLGITIQDLDRKPKHSFMNSKNDPKDIIDLRYENHKEEIVKLINSIISERKSILKNGSVIERNHPQNINESGGSFSRMEQFNSPSKGEQMDEVKARI